MRTGNLLAYISREFFEEHNVNRYRMKKIIEMDDEEVIRCCHWYCEENNLTNEWDSYRNKIEAQYCYCPYFEEYVYDGLCYDMQMVANGMIKPSVLPDVTIDKTRLNELCKDCEYGI